MANKIVRRCTGILIVIAALVFISINYIVPKVQHRNNVSKYYKALINEDYEEAFNYLLIWDQFVSEPSRYTNNEAKDLYLSKVDKLQSNYNYKVIKATSKEVSGDGASLFETDITVSINNETYIYKELIQLRQNGKIFIDYSEDQYAHFRDGKMAGWNELSK